MEHHVHEKYNSAHNFISLQLSITISQFVTVLLNTVGIEDFVMGSFHIKSPRFCKVTSRILTKLGVFVVPMVLTTHTNF